MGCYFSGIYICDSRLCICKVNFRGRDKVFTLYLATMMIPFHVTVITNFLQMSMYGLVNTLWSLMLPASVSAFGTF